MRNNIQRRIAAIKIMEQKAAMEQNENHKYFLEKFNDGVSVEMKRKDA